MSKSYGEKIQKIHKQLLMSQYENMAVQMIEWDGMPDEIPKYAPERWLYTQGQATFFKIPATDEYAILPVASGSVKLDIYGRPQEWRAFAVGTSEQARYINGLTLNSDNAVIIWSNQRHTADSIYVNEIVNKMVSVDRTLDINNLIMRTPFAIKGNKDTILTMQNLIKSINDGDAFILQNDQTGAVTSDIDVVDLGVDWLGVELSEQYETYHDRILRFFGIDYLPVEKRERMVTDEANANNQELEVRRLARLAYREVACDEINKLFGLNLSVSYKEPDYEQPDTNTQTMSGTPEDSSESE